MVTIEDVAVRAGVSVTTVSHVVNRTRPVSNELVTRVHAAMDELGYQPNALARSLRRKQSHTIGMIVPDNANPFFAEIARGIEDTSFADGYVVILCNSDGDVERESIYIDLLMKKQVDGVLLVAAGASADGVVQLLSRKLPLVVVDRDLPGLEVDRALTDNFLGGAIATEHLLQLGHRRIGCITGPAELTLSAQRVQGYRQALAETGIPVDPDLIVQGDFRDRGGYLAALALFQLPAPPTAIFACNDLMAIGAISAALELGMQVPETLSVVGFDDIHLALYANPPLTTVAQPKYALGKAAAEMLIERMQDPLLAPRHRLLATTLVVRRSTASYAA